MNLTATLFGQMGTFAVLVWFVGRYLWGPMTTMLADRNKRIADGLAAADRGKHELELASQRAADVLRKAKQEAADIVSAANKQASQLVEQARTDARAEGQRQLEAAQAEIEQEKKRAQEQLHEQAVGLAILCAEKVLEREINAANHAVFIQQMIKKI
ncbi:F0F1 ATP synthase subunit B [Thioflexithrix psekupsensis]|uniref:ATP synthase subunit b n=1 Tax=Thioflexithrix psekupsensis TaxID=1570016 RepID=A0A251X453_9GAMM|nr:F0F1 ATP synthase subunit B [Thioflexithrix psekupsensis]OUD12231.1 F0F1 ATP synthase subunit B [Thioflexithrix psekupsensis]